MWQYIIVYIIGLAAFGYVGYKTYRMLTTPKSNNPCEGCSGCSLKKELQKGCEKRER